MLVFPTLSVTLGEGLMTKYHFATSSPHLPRVGTAIELFWAT